MPSRLLRSHPSKNFHKRFAGASLGFFLVALGLVAPVACPQTPDSATTRRDAASAQFDRAEEQRQALDAKPLEKRTLADYKQVVNSYRRVSLITPRAAAVPDSLMAVGELNTEMGNKFGRSYYQAAVDSYEFLIREYPASKHVQDAMWRVANLQKDQLGDTAAATKTFQEFQHKFPRSGKKREIQEAYAELALMRDQDSGKTPAKMPTMPAKTTSTVATTPPASAPAAASPAGVGEETPSTLLPVISKQGGAPNQSGSVPRVQKIRTSLTASSTEVLLDLEDSVQYDSGRIANPDRIYFDLHTARLSSSVARGNIAVTGTLLSRVRVSQNQTGVVRVVLDVANVRDYSASLVPNPWRLVIELYGDGAIPRNEPTQIAKIATPEPKSDIPAPASKTANSAKLKTTGSPTAVAATDTHATTSSQPVANSATSPAVTSAVISETTAPSSLPAPKSNVMPAKTRNAKADVPQPASVPQPTRDGQSTLTRALGLKIGRIVIDAGHGGHDTGTIGPTGLMEKDLCLDIALRIGKLIQAKLPDTDIVYTRSDDTFIPLEERTRIANETKADLFVSIHANSSPDHGARGVETYYLNLKGSPEAMEVAARENAVSQESIHDLQDLVKQIARTEKIDESKELAEDIQDSLSKRIQKTAKPVKNRGVRKAPFVVLIGADMPSILTEISFLSNPADEQLLKKPEHRQRIAEGVFAGMTAYLQSLNSMNVTQARKPSKPPVVPTVESRNQN